jgi:hypothetical protein
MSHTQPYLNDTIRAGYSKLSTKRKNRAYIICSVAIIMGAIGSLAMIAGFFNNGGLNPQNDERAARTSILSNSLDTGEVRGNVVSHNALSPTGATVLAYESSGFYTSIEKNGGYPIKATVSIDNTFSIDLPSGVYNLIVFYHDGTHDVVKNLIVEPNTTRTLLFDYY